jgi:hypothetical protein
MGKSSTNQKEMLDLLIAEKPNELKKIINHIREIVLDVDPLISEQVKWNSPSFYYTGELKSNIAKEYPRDILVLNLSLQFFSTSIVNLRVSKLRPAECLLR